MGRAFAAKLLLCLLCLLSGHVHDAVAKYTVHQAAQERLHDKYDSQDGAASANSGRSRRTSWLVALSSSSLLLLLLSSSAADSG